ncbi:helix-turn-helix transcriptional regulator [Reinekea blandensis]|uniref:Transcriptional regulatory protein n=1 Tax=Reinekea blandensis MED297 TaxID=314283 RepID=A4BET1_9GAMM|nr:helix-turn-helix transcriptional regulator [Reinekea blandensis]EAR09266.1 transcriptional regulatory protein [Reinekea sp. MED297] [Reinekea blandensis MED297]
MTSPSAMLMMLSGITLGCIVMLVLAVAKDFVRLRVGQIFLLLLLSTTVFVLDPWLPAVAAPFSNLFMSSIPALFWLFCHHAFGDNPTLPRPLLIVALWTVAGPALLLFMTASQLGLFLFKQVPSWGEYLLIGAGLWSIVEHWRSDLVSSRRRLRAVVVSLTGVTILLNVISVNFGFGSELFQRALVMLCLIGIGSQILQVPRGLLFGSLPPNPTPELTTVADDKTQRIQQQLQALQQLMSAGYYRREKPTIAELAGELGLPEYVLRSLINEHLGFRNFNAYINDWRINEAKTRLREQPDTPIMNVALDLGYRTLSSFNRAFKERVEQTPTQFRQGTGAHQASGD